MYNFDVTSRHDGLRLFSIIRIFIYSIFLICTNIYYYAHGATEGDPSTLLRAVLRNQEATDRLSAQIEVQIQLGHLTNTSLLRGSFVLLRDKDRLDLAGEFVDLDAPAGGKSRKIRMVSNNELSVSYSISAASGVKIPKGGVVTKKQRAREVAGILESPYYSGSLDGYALGSDGYRLAEILLRAGTAKIRGREKIGNIECSLVAGQTAYGHISLWVGPGETHTIQRFVYEKGASHPFIDGKTLAGQGNRNPAYGNQYLTGWRATLERVEYQVLGAAAVAVRGRLTERFKLADGRSVVNSYDYARRDVRLNPTIDESSAFRTDLPEGARLTNMDDPNSGVVYTWRDGTVRAAYGEFEAKGDFRNDSRSNWVKFIALIVLCAAVFIAARQLTKANKSD